MVDFIINYLIPVIVFIAGAIIGYFFCKWKERRELNSMVKFGLSGLHENCPHHMHEHKPLKIIYRLKDQPAFK